MFQVVVGVYESQPKRDASTGLPIFRQTFFSTGLANTILFAAEAPGVDETVNATWLVSFGGEIVPANLLARYPKRRRIYVQMEHPNFYLPDKDYLSSFGLILSPFQLEPRPGTIHLRSQAGLPWFYGIPFRTDSGLTHKVSSGRVLALEDLVSQCKPTKKKKLSCVVSQKNLTAGQRWRLQLALKIKELQPELIDLYGFGWNPISDKREAIDPYEYTLAIENFSSEHYWTEKLSDAILGYTCPIYSGASAIDQYFEKGLITLPYGGDVTEVAQLIIREVSSDPDTTALYENRLKLLFKFNVFYMLANYISEYN